MVLTRGSGDFTADVTASGKVAAPSGTFADSLTVSGIPVPLEPGGLSALVDDTSPELGGSLDTNGNAIFTSGFLNMASTGGNVQFGSFSGNNSLFGFGGGSVSLSTDTTVLTVSGAGDDTDGVGVQDNLTVEGSIYSDSVLVSGTPVSLEPAITDHGELDGLSGNDHPQYALREGQDLGGFGQQIAGGVTTGNLRLQARSFFSGGEIILRDNSVVDADLTVSGTTTVGDVVGLVEETIIPEPFPGSGTIPLCPSARYPRTINGLFGAKGDGNTVHATVFLNGSPVEGLDNMTISGSAQDFSATANNSVAQGDRYVLTFSGSTGLRDFEAALQTTRSSA